MSVGENIRYQEGHDVDGPILKCRIAGAVEVPIFGALDGWPANRRSGPDRAPTVPSGALGPAQPAYNEHCCPYLQEVIDDDLDWTHHPMPGEGGRRP